MSRSVDCYYPGRSFPAISVTGRACALSCKHCAGRYLEGMIPATDSEELLEVAKTLARRGAKGFLLSGGVDETGRVPVAEVLPAIREIKETTELLINAHIGLSSTVEIADLVRAGIDAFSVDIYGSDAIISDVLGLRANVGDYFRVLNDLKERGAYFAPHICIGIHEGKLDGEVSAIERLAGIQPNALVLLSLIPTKGTVYGNLKNPDKEDVLTVIRTARRILPETKILLGCMRSRLERDIEFEAVKSGVDGIVLPSSATVERLKAEGFRITERDECCAIPQHHL